MAGIDITDAQSILDNLVALSLNFDGQDEVEILGKKVKFTNLGTLQNAIEFWDTKCKEIQARGTRTGRRVRGGTVPYPRESAEDA